MMAAKNIQKQFLEISFDKNKTSHVNFNKLIQLESEIIKCDLKKRCADISIIFIFGLMFVSIF